MFISKGKKYFMFISKGKKYFMCISKGKRYFMFISKVAKEKGISYLLAKETLFHAY